MKKTIPCPAWMLELFPKKCDSFLHKKLYFFSKTGTFLKKTIPCPQGSGLANACDSFSIGKTVLFSKTRMFLKKTIPCPAWMLELFPKKCDSFLHKKLYFFSKTGTFLKKNNPLSSMDAGTFSKKNNFFFRFLSCFSAQKSIIKMQAENGTSAFYLPVILSITFWRNQKK